MGWEHHRWHDIYAVENVDYTRDPTTMPSPSPTSEYDLCVFTAMATCAADFSDAPTSTPSNAPSLLPTSSQPTPVPSRLPTGAPTLPVANTHKSSDSNADATTYATAYPGSFSVPDIIPNTNADSGTNACAIRISDNQHSVQANAGSDNLRVPSIIPSPGPTVTVRPSRCLLWYLRGYRV